MEQPNGLLSRPRSIPFEAHGKLVSVEIILDRRDGPNGVGVYTPGDQMKGYIRLELAQRLTVSNIDLLVQGTGNVTWKMRTVQGAEEVITDDEVYLNDIAELVGKQRNEMVTLSAGEHIFPFACDLPFELPATFTGSIGYVSYLVKVIIQADRNEPAHADPCVTTALFLLESRLSMAGLTDQLNAYRVDYKHPVKTSGLQTGSSCVKVALFLPRRAYDIGDTIVINMSLTNTSKRAVKSMSMSLIMEVTYQARGKPALERLLVVDHEDKFAVGHLESRQWRHVGITVPRYIPPSGLPHSTIISIRYLLVFKAELERTQDSLIIETPVLVGLELPDELKLSSAALENNFSAAAINDRDSARQSISQPIYQSAREPSFQSSLPTPSLSAATIANQRPLYIDVQRLERPQPQNSHQPPPVQLQRPVQPQVQPKQPYQGYARVHQPQPQTSPRADSDTQVISMRFTDELDDHSPYGQPYNLQQHSQPSQSHHQPKVSRNPLYVSDVNDTNGGSYQNGEPRFGSSENSERMMATMADPSVGNEMEEVLY